MRDWIDSYVDETAKVPSPESYRLWSAITAVSGVLERKVYSVGQAGPIYPNIFTLLVGPPASGKTNAIRPIRELWARMDGLSLAPDNVNRASLIDALTKCFRTVVNGTTAAYSFSAMAVPCSEFGVFFTHHDIAFLSILNHIFDAPPSYREDRIVSGVREVNKPYLVVLAGTQPDFLNSFLPEEAWGMGFMSRLIMIYADKAPPTDIFGTIAQSSTTMIPELGKIFDLKGEFTWTMNAVNEINAWNRLGCPPVPEHNKLSHYCGRRGLYVAKLSMISAVSRSAGLTVTAEDVERAKSWLLEAEGPMPDIFRAMGAKSDSQVIKDMHYHLYRLWATLALKERKPLPTKELYKFLHERVPSDKIIRLIEVAEKTGYIRRGTYPDEWIPSPIGGFGADVAL